MRCYRAKELDHIEGFVCELIIDMFDFVDEDFDNLFETIKKTIELHKGKKLSYEEVDYRGIELYIEEDMIHIINYLSKKEITQLIRKIEFDGDDDTLGDIVTKVPDSLKQRVLKQMEDSFLESYGSKDDDWALEHHFKLLHKGL